MARSMMSIIKRQECGHIFTDALRLELPSLQGQSMEPETPVTDKILQYYGVR